MCELSLDCWRCLHGKESKTCENFYNLVNEWKSLAQKCVRKLASLKAVESLNKISRTENNCNAIEFNSICPRKRPGESDVRFDVFAEKFVR